MRDGMKLKGVYKMKNVEQIYFCFRYKCKKCPKQRECEQEKKKKKR